VLEMVENDFLVDLFEGHKLIVRPGGQNDNKRCFPEQLTI
jgi:hypothetical protein